MELLGVHRLENKSDRTEVLKGYKKLANPHNVTHITTGKDIEAGWGALRRR